MATVRPAPTLNGPQFLHCIDLTSIGYYKPGFAYPGLGTWILGIDNIEIDFQAGPTPTPSPTPNTYFYARS